MILAHPSPWRLVGAIAAIAFVAALGELRVPDARAVSGPRTNAVADEPALRSVDAGADAIRLGADADGSSVEADGDARLIPAVYARDQDMRFVFYRRVSKWM